MGGKFLRETKDLVFVNYTGYSLDEIEKDCWLRLVNGAIKSRDPFHTPCVATVKMGK